MPRKGKGQQPIQTPKGGQYGEGKRMADAQRQQPLPQDVELMSEASPMPQREQRVAPGDIRLNAPTSKPGSGKYAPASPPNMKVGVTDEERAKISTLIPVLSMIANTPHASRHLRSTLRRAKAQIGDVSDFADKGL